METLIIDASIAVKWAIQEDDSEAAVGLRAQFRFAAPDLLVVECSNILWKKAQRSEITRDEALMASRLLQHSGVELISMGSLLQETTALAIDLGHPAYDCVYLALARQRQSRFVTADKKLLQVVSRKAPEHLMKLCVSLDKVHVGYKDR